MKDLGDVIGPGTTSDAYEAYKLRHSPHASELDLLGIKGDIQDDYMESEDDLLTYHVRFSKDLDSSTGTRISSYADFLVENGMDVKLDTIFEREFHEVITRHLIRNTTSDKTSTKSLKSNRVHDNVHVFRKGLNDNWIDNNRKVDFKDENVKSSNRFESKGTHEELMDELYDLDRESMAHLYSRRIDYGAKNHWDVPLKSRQKILEYFSKELPGKPANSDQELSVRAILGTVDTDADFAEKMMEVKNSTIVSTAMSNFAHFNYLGEIDKKQFVYFYMHENPIVRDVLVMKVSSGRWKLNCEAMNVIRPSIKGVRGLTPQMKQFRTVVNRYFESRGCR